jgi:hypothetical protein
LVLVKRHVSAYLEAIFRFTKPIYTTFTSVPLPTLFIWYVFHAFMHAVYQAVYLVEHVRRHVQYNIVFLMMNIRCSKHVEDKTN